VSLLPGTLVAGRFLVEELAGKGGMAEVFRARDISTGGAAALKVLQAGRARDEEVERFLREARLLAMLRHAGIVAYLMNGRTQDGRGFLALEWLEGQNLEQRLAQGPMRIDDCRVLLARVADALGAAHRHGVVHRDIKPSNLFLRHGCIDGVTLVDFGVARSALLGTTLTRTGALIGTPHYMAPEQARGEWSVGPSADVFALGCVLFECLSGRRLFDGKDPFAVLAKVVLAGAPEITSLRPRVPPALSDLLARMLDKDPLRRPQDGDELSAEIAALGLPPGSGESDDAFEARGAPASGAGSPARSVVLSSDALKLLCVVLAVKDTDGGWETPEVAAEHSLRCGLLVRLSRLGGRVEPLADGSLAVIVPPAASAQDQATVAARCALAVKSAWPAARVALTTGRGLLEHRLATGEAIDRAASLLKTAEAGATSTAAPDVAARGFGILLDTLSANLLEPRFMIASESSPPTLINERASPDESRPLLGRATPCVGREQELLVLSASLERCVESAEPGGVLVIAPPGMGKSRLKHEFVRRLGERPRGVEVLVGSGTPMSAGSPYGHLGQAMRRLCDIQAGDGPAQELEKLRSVAGEATLDFLAELCAIPVEKPGPQLLRARSDPKMMGDEIQRAFLDALASRAALRPCLLVLEDLHWSDAGTVRLVDAALMDLRDRPFFVLAFARPEVSERFPRLWDGRIVQHIRLAGLGRKACERLIATVLGDGLSEAARARIIDLAGGNPLFLEELIRSAAEGKTDAQPDTVLAMLQAKLSCLEPEARRLLCSASIFGQSFSFGGALALLGQDHQPKEAELSLSGLIQAEIVERRRSRTAQGDVEYRFRHALVRDAAYSLLPDRDRALGHRLAALYLEGTGESHPVVLAEHLARSDDPSRAGPHYLRAAELAMRTNDTDSAVLFAERGVASDARGPARLALLGLLCEIFWWRNNWSAAASYGEEVFRLAPKGSGSWARAAMSRLVELHARGRTRDFVAMLEEIREVAPMPDALDGFAVSVAILVFMLVSGGHWTLGERCLDWLLQLGEGPRGAEPALDAARRRAKVTASGSAGWHAWVVGDLEEAERLLRDANTNNDDLGPVATFQRFFLAHVLADRGELDEAHARAVALVEMGSSRRRTVDEGVGRWVLAEVLRRRGDLADAEREALRAVALLAAHPIDQMGALAALARIRCATGDARAALDDAKRSLDLFAELRMFDFYRGANARLAYAEALHAAGMDGDARSAIADARGRLLAQAAQFEDEGCSRCFLENVPENARTLELAERWLAEPVSR
jgi:eukaryotic-like serine/threonine-protein kinase